MAMNTEMREMKIEIQEELDHEQGLLQDRLRKLITETVLNKFGTPDQEESVEKRNAVDQAKQYCYATFQEMDEKLWADNIDLALDSFYDGYLLRAGIVAFLDHC